MIENLLPESELVEIIKDFDANLFLSPTYGFDQAAVINCVTGEIRIEESTHSTYTRYSDDDICVTFANVKWDSIKDFINDAEDEDKQCWVNDFEIDLDQCFYEGYAELQRRF